MSFPSHSAFAALRHRDFRLLWLGQIVSVTGSQMQFVAINWHVYLLTKSAFALGLVGLFRGVPIILCSLAGGVVADAVDRKRLMVVTSAFGSDWRACLPDLRGDCGGEVEEFDGV